VSGASSIEWTDQTWNPVRGCSMAPGSETGGCLNCYAARMAARNLPGMRSPTTGKNFARMLGAGPRWTGEVELITAVLDWPLRRRKPLRIFVNSTSDLFHENLSDEAIDQVFAVMALAPRHTFQILTKRPERMRSYLAPGQYRDVRVSDAAKIRSKRTSPYTLPCESIFDARRVARGEPWLIHAWPLPNVWLGTSVENQATADERIPNLLATPAAVRFVSYEPALGPVKFKPWLTKSTTRHLGISVDGAIRNRSFDCLQDDSGRPLSQDQARIELHNLQARGVKLIPAGGCETFDPQTGCPGHQNPRLDWIIVGGESGPGARPFDIAWARSTVAQCKAAGVAVFVKQLGSRPYGWWWSESDERKPPSGLSFGERGNVNAEWNLNHRKGGDPSEWPEDLRVQEFPR